MILIKADRYEGEFRDNRKHGYGVFETNNPYAGNFEK